MWHAAGFERSWRTVVIVASASAAALHFAAVRPHMGEWVPAAMFMACAGLAQFGWALWIARSAGPLATFAGVVLNTGIIGLWIVSRTEGLPFGPNAGMPEHIHGPDVLATVFEAVIVVACFSRLRPVAPSPFVMRLVAAGAIASVAVAADDAVGDRLTAAAGLLVGLLARSLVRCDSAYQVRRSNEIAFVRSIGRHVRAAGRAVNVARGPRTRRA